MKRKSWRNARNVIFERLIKILFPGGQKYQGFCHNSGAKESYE